MKAAELRELTVEQLQAKLAELKEELFNLRFQLEIKQLETKIEKFFLELSELCLKLLDSQFSKFCCLHS